MNEQNKLTMQFLNGSSNLLGMALPGAWQDEKAIQLVKSLTLMHLAFMQVNGLIAGYSPTEDGGFVVQMTDRSAYGMRFAQQEVLDGGGA